jgi:hypothetical protein
MIHLHEKISLCLSSVSEAKRSYRSKSKNLCFFTVQTEESIPNCSSTVQLGDVHSFVASLCKSIRHNSNKVFVACVRAQDVKGLTNTAILIGAYMILGLEMNVEEVSEAFKTVSNMLARMSDPAVESSAFILDSWKALHRVRSLGWINMSETDLAAHDDESAYQSLDVEEYNHYSDPANGGLHIIAPGRLLLIPSPIDFPDGRDWMDIDGSRRFSAAFFSDLLEAEFSASLVLRISYEDETIEYDPSAFEDRGIAVESVALGPRGESEHHLLAAADRLIANLRGSPGAIAVHVQGCGTGFGGSAGVLLATGLMSVFGFGTGEAAAWLRMSCPPLGVSSAELSADLQHRLTELSMGGSFLQRSASAPAPSTASLAASRASWSGQVLRAVSA